MLLFFKSAYPSIPSRLNLQNQDDGKVMSKVVMTPKMS